jgi:hypothetical protein
MTDSTNSARSSDSTVVPQQGNTSNTSSDNKDTVDELGHYSDSILNYLMEKISLTADITMDLFQADINALELKDEPAGSVREETQRGRSRVRNTGRKRRRERTHPYTRPPPLS